MRLAWCRWSWCSRSAIGTCAEICQIWTSGSGSVVSSSSPFVFLKRWIVGLVFLFWQKCVVSSSALIQTLLNSAKQLCVCVCVCVCVCISIRPEGKKSIWASNGLRGGCTERNAFFSNPHLTQEAFTRSLVCLFFYSFIFSLFFRFSFWFELIFDIRACPGMSVTNCSPTLWQCLLFSRAFLWPSSFFHFFLFFLFFPSRSGAPDVKQPRYGSFGFPFFCLVRNRSVRLSPPSVFCPQHCPSSPSYCVAVRPEDDLWPPDTGNALLLSLSPLGWNDSSVVRCHSQMKGVFVFRMHRVSFCGHSHCLAITHAVN